MVKKLMKSIINSRQEIIDTMSLTLFGQIVLTVGVLNENSIYQMNKVYNKLKTKQLKDINTIKEVTEWVINELYANHEIIKDYLVLVTDTNNVKSPMVGFMVQGHLAPIRPDGDTFGIYLDAMMGKVNAQVEFVLQ